MSMSRSVTTVKADTRNIFVLVGAVIGVYANSLRNGFVWDDRIYFIGNPVYRSFDLKAIFFSLANGTEYLPIRDLTIALDYAIWGEWAAGFHLSNILYATAAVIGAFIVTRQLLEFLGAAHELPSADLVPLYTALCFALHPLQAQAFNWISCRSVLVSGGLVFATVSCYLRYLRQDGARRAIFLGAALVSCVLAILGKATAIALPLLLLLLLLFSPKRNSGREYAALAPFFAAAAAIFWFFKKIALSDRTIGHEQYDLASWLERLGVACQIPFFYLKKVLIPFGLSADYDIRFSGDLGSGAAMLSLLALVVLVISSVAVRKRCPVWSAGFGWFLVTLLPVLNFYETTPVVADRYVFLPLYGVFLAASLLVVRGAERAGRRRAVHGFMLLLLLWWGSLTFGGNAVWRDDKSLWTDVIAASPGNIRGYYHLGQVYADEGEYGRAAELFWKVEALAPWTFWYELAMGDLSLRMGNHQRAADWAGVILEQRRDDLRALTLLVKVSVARGKSREALEFYQRMRSSAELDVDSAALLQEARESIIDSEKPGLAGKGLSQRGESVPIGR